jgi:hypothetical protein
MRWARLSRPRPPGRPQVSKAAEQSSTSQRLILWTMDQDGTNRETFGQGRAAVRKLHPHHSADGAINPCSARFRRAATA